MELLYCIKCGKTVGAEWSPIGIGHEFTMTTDDHPFCDVDFCEMDDGWATCPPPEVPTIDEYMVALILDSTVSTDEEVERLR